MKTYKVIRTCTLKKRYLEEGQIIELDDDVVVHKHLELISGVKADPVKKEGSLSDLQQKQNDAIKPKSGFASSLYSEKTEEKPSQKEPVKDKAFKKKSS